MKLTDQQSKQFIERYRDRYGQAPNATLEVPISKQAEEEQAWHNIIKEILGKKYNDTYKHRPWGREILGTKVFNSLFLLYGPKFI